MKRYNVFLVCFFVFVASGCAQVKVQAGDNESGIIEKVPQFYHIENNISTPTWGEGMRQKIWYKNQMTIKEMKGFYSNTMNKQTTMTYPVHCYLFKYQPTGIIYEYRHFSDTAQVLQVFKKTDYVSLVSGVPYQDEQLPQLKSHGDDYLSDTLVDQVNYKRRLLHREDSTGKLYYFMVYFRCDKKDGFLKSYNLALEESKKVGCPATKSYAVLSPHNKLPLFSEKILFFADSLTKEEEKVFAAWEKRAKEDAAYKKADYGQ